MQERVIAYIEQYALLPARGTVVVAVSGGADSLCLSHLFFRLCGQGKRYPEIRVHIAHLNHQLRGNESEQEAMQIARLAELWHLPYTIGISDVPALAQQERRSLEDAARVARYRFLREVAQGQPIAIAHHQDDQVETLLLHWIRGGGTASMVGLQPHQQDIIRPLLSVTHAETLAYCEKHGLTPIEDASNNDTRFYRNRIRHDLLPLLETMNASFRATLLRNAEVIRVDVEWIETQVEQVWSRVILVERDTTFVLSIPHIRALSLSIQRHLLRRVTSILSAGQSPLEVRHYLLIEQLMQREDNIHDVALNLPDALIVKRNNDRLVFQRLDTEETPATFMQQGMEKDILLFVPSSVRLYGTPWRVVAELLPEETLYKVCQALACHDWQRVWRLLDATAYTVYLDAEFVGQNLHIRTRRPGDMLQPLGMTHEKKVQDILIDKHIPRDQRDTLPLIFNTEGCPLWLGGVCVDNRARITEHTQHIICLKLLKN
ncbi:MAG: tRNA lysidine(34) synthetase TilS [Ktedonobacteraceae bacterium]